MQTQTRHSVTILQTCPQLLCIRLSEHGPSYSIFSSICSTTTASKPDTDLSTSVTGMVVVEGLQMLRAMRLRTLESACSSVESASRAVIAYRTSRENSAIMASVRPKDSVVNLAYCQLSIHSIDAARFSQQVWKIPYHVL